MRRSAVTRTRLKPFRGDELNERPPLTGFKRPAYRYGTPSLLGHWKIASLLYPNGKISRRGLSVCRTKPKLYRLFVC
jgi:hypothetical protein